SAFTTSVVFQAEDGIRDLTVTGVQTCALPIYTSTLWAMGLTQHANGTDLVTSLLNLMFACGMIGRWGAAMLPSRGQNNVQGASDMGAIPFVYTDYQPVGDRAVRDRFAQTWHVPAESLSLATGLMITEVVRPESAVRGMYIMGENP